MKKDYIAPEINIIHFKNGDVMMSSHGSHTCNNGDVDGDGNCDDNFDCGSDSLCDWHSNGCSSDICYCDSDCQYESGT